MPKEMMRIEGLKELETALMELPKATGKNTIRRALTTVAQPFVDDAAALIRVRRVKPTVVTTKVKFSSGSAGKRAFAEAMARGATREEAGVAAHAANAEAGSDANVTSGYLALGPTKRAFYGFEFGTVKLAPAPFMRPAWEQNKVSAAEGIREVLWEEIQKAAKRLAKKASRDIK